MDAVLRQRLDRYAMNAFNSAREKIKAESEQKMAELPQMGNGNAGYSKYADDRFIKLYAQRINDLTIAKGNALMDAHEISGVPLDDLQILSEVTLFRDQTVAGMVAAIRGELDMEDLRTRQHSRRALRIGARFQQEMAIRTNHIVGEISCQVEQRKVMPKFRKPEPNVPTMLFQGNTFQDNTRLNVNSIDNSINTITQNSVFTEIRKQIVSGIRQEEQTTILQRLNALEQAQAHPVLFKELYLHFMANSRRPCNAVDLFACAH